MRSFITCCLLLISFSVQSQFSWRQVEDPKLSVFPQPLVKERYFQLQKSSSLKGFYNSQADYLTQISVPNENGEEELFQLEPAAVMAPSLASKYSRSAFILYVTQHKLSSYGSVSNILTDMFFGLKIPASFCT